MEPVEPVEMNICQSNTYRKGLSWLPFDNKPKGQTRQQLKEKQSYISVAYLTILSGMTTVFHAKPYGTFIETLSNLRRQKLHGSNQGFNFHEGSFCFLF